MITATLRHLRDFEPTINIHSSLIVCTGVIDAPDWISLVACSDLAWEEVSGTVRARSLSDEENPTVLLHYARLPTSAALSFALKAYLIDTSPPPYRSLAPPLVLY